MSKKRHNLVTLGITRSTLLLVELLTIALCAGCGSSSSGQGASTNGSPPSGSTSSIQVSQFADQPKVLAAVKSATSLTSMPSSAVTQLQSLAVGSETGHNFLPHCQVPSTFESTVNVASCTFGDRTSSTTMVLVGDSRAEMWFNPIETIATAEHIKLVLLAKAGCPSAQASFRLNNNGALSEAPWPACTAWQNFVSSTIAKLAPKIVVVADSVDLDLTTEPGAASPSTAQSDFASFFKSLPSGAKIVLLGGFPSPASTGATPTICLSKSPASIQSCSFPQSPQETQRNNALALAAEGAGGAVIDVSQWLCASVCPPVIAGNVVYTPDGYHLNHYYVQYLTGVLWAALKPYLS